MIVKCACQNCGQNIEFEAEHDGTFVDCPGCARPTRLLIPGPGRHRAFSAPNAKKSFPWAKVIGIAVAVVIVIATVIVLVNTFGVEQTASTTGTVLGFGIIGIIELVLGILAFVLAVFWLIFPWMMYAKMSKVIEVLEQIRDQKSA